MDGDAGAVGLPSSGGPAPVTPGEWHGALAPPRWNASHSENLTHIGSTSMECRILRAEPSHLRARLWGGADEASVPPRNRPRRSRRGSQNSPFGKTLLAICHFPV